MPDPLTFRRLELIIVSRSLIVASRCCVAVRCERDDVNGGARYVSDCEGRVYNMALMLRKGKYFITESQTYQHQHHS